MKYVRNPHKAKQMLNLVHEGNYLDEVTKRYYDDTIVWSLTQAPSAEEAEALHLDDKWVKSAVARRIWFEN